jgi:hypothetical protein
MQYPSVRAPYAFVRTQLRSFMVWIKDQCTLLSIAMIYVPERNKTDVHIQVFMERGKEQYNSEMLHAYSVDG